MGNTFPGVFRFSNDLREVRTKICNLWQGFRVPLKEVLICFSSSSFGRGRMDPRRKGQDERSDFSVRKDLLHYGFYRKECSILSLFSKTHPWDLRLRWRRGKCKRHRVKEIDILSILVINGGVSHNTRNVLNFVFFMNLVPGRISHMRYLQSLINEIESRLSGVFL